jgi:hypothetical protein
MTTPYIDPQTVHNPATGTSPPASWGDTVRDNQQFFSTPPSVKTRRTAVQSIPNNTFTAVAFTAADTWDTDGFHSTTTNNSRITVPAGLGGIYHVIGSVNFAAGADNTRLVKIQLNGSSDVTVYQGTNGVGGPAFAVSVPNMVQLAAGDYIELVCYQFSGSALSITATMSAHWVSL